MTGGTGASLYTDGSNSHWGQRHNWRGVGFVPNLYGIARIVLNSIQFQWCMRSGTIWSSEGEAVAGPRQQGDMAKLRPAGGEVAEGAVGNDNEWWLLPVWLLLVVRLVTGGVARVV